MAMAFNLTEREHLVLRLREEGETYQNIGDALGVSGNRARQIAVKARLKIAAEAKRANIADNDINHLGLSTRARNACMRANLRTIDDLLEYRTLSDIRNIGPKTAQEIIEKIRIYKGE